MMILEGIKGLFVQQQQYKNGLKDPLLPISQIVETTDEEQKEFIENYCKRIRIHSGKDALFVTDLLVGISYGYNIRNARFWWIQNGHFLAKYCIKYYNLRPVSVCKHTYGKFLIFSNADIRNCINQIIVMFHKFGRLLQITERVPWDPEYDDSTVSNGSDSDSDSSSDEGRPVEMAEVVVHNSSSQETKHIITQKKIE